MVANRAVDGVRKMTTGAINPFLADALEAHGGVERWRTFAGLTSTIRSGGRLWGLKGIDMPPIPRVATTDFRRQWMSVTPFGDPDWTMTWVPERIVIESSTNHVIAERENPRDAFAGHEYTTLRGIRSTSLTSTGMRCGPTTPVRRQDLADRLR